MPAQSETEPGTPAETRARFRPATRADARDIALFYRMASEGVSDYVWSLLAEPGEDLLDVGARRYEREKTAFSYENCEIAELDGKVAGIAFQTLKEAENIGEMVPTSLIRKFLRGVKEGRATMIPGLGVSTQNLDTEPDQAVERQMREEAGASTEQDLLNVVHQVQAQGFAYDDEEAEKGVGCIGVVIRNSNGDIEGGLSLSAPIERRKEEWVQVVIEKGKRLSERLGYFG